MICPVAHSDIPSAPEGCTIELKSLKGKDILKHWNAVMKESPEWMKNLHRNFVNHFSALQGNVSDERQKTIVAYRYYNQSQKHPVKRKGEPGTHYVNDKIGSISMENGHFYEDGKEILRDKLQEKYPYIRLPESQHDRMLESKKVLEVIHDRISSASNNP